MAARIEASTQGLDIRFVVTNLVNGSAEWLYDTLQICARGQAENLIKLHRSPVSCSSSGVGGLAIEPTCRIGDAGMGVVAVRPASVKNAE